ncbi:MAG: glycosyltransferase family 4 protein [Phycisphaerae bacterium]|nr:glycosyltransferase family 4 protein [Phycisphaerae bacterium]MDW8261178.1 glycosyltransferase family 4 protein [Phycisphaerales bacterium]
MRPWVLISGDFVDTGGMDRANAALARYLAQQGIPTHLVAFRADPQLLDRKEVTFHRVPKPLGAYTLGLPLLDRLGRRVARRMARQHRARVLVNGGCCRFGDVNWVHFVNAAWTPQSHRAGFRRAVGRFNHRRGCRDERAALTRARVIIANSRLTAAHITQWIPVAPELIHTVYYGVDRSRFFPLAEAQRIDACHELHFPPDRPLFAFVGGLGDRRKGFDTVLAAWPQISGRIDGALLLVIGSGSEAAAFARIVEDRGLSSSIRFLGRREDVHRVLQCCHAMVAPTRYEAYGLAVHEAICCGVAAIVSRHSGVAERFPRDLEELLLEDVESPGELAARVISWWERRSRLAGALSAFCEELRSRSWEDMSREITQIAQINAPNEG